MTLGLLLLSLGLSCGGQEDLSALPSPQVSMTPFSIVVSTSTTMAEPTATAMPTTMGAPSATTESGTAAEPRVETVVPSVPPTETPIALAPLPPTQTPSPQPQPTETPAPQSGVSFQFDAVSAADEATIRDGIARAQSFIQANFGVVSSTFSVFASSTPEGITQMYIGWFRITHPPAIDTIRARWTGGNTAEATYRSIFIHTSGPSWLNHSPAHFSTIAHEYFHVVQYDLVGQAIAEQDWQTNLALVRASGPIWLTEGSAMSVGERASRSDYEGYLSGLRNFLTTVSFSLQAMESMSGFQSVGPGYAIGEVATDFLIRTRGLSSLATYYTRIGQGSDWQTAFIEAFGLTVNDFYAAFEAYRANGFN